MEADSLDTMSRNILPFLYPFLHRTTRTFKPKHVGAYISLHRRCTRSLATQGPHDAEKQKRLHQLNEVQLLEKYYPRLVSSAGVDGLSVDAFVKKFTNISGKTNDIVSVLGRIRSVRLLGRNLVFVDIEQNRERTQIMVDSNQLQHVAEGKSEDFHNFKKVVKVGDWISVEGSPTKTKSGQLSVLALKPPRVVAPCLHHLPEKVDDPETLARRPHIHQLTSREPGDILLLRSLVYSFLRKYFVQEGFLEVETPMFDVNAGGAIARPFETVANELSDMALKLRIAPELNLKRLVIGGQHRVYELGRVFRNEGVDKTHNPEFSTCEFYEVGATLPSLIQRTEAMITGIYTLVKELRPTLFPSLTPPSDIHFSTPFATLPFVPTIEKGLNHKLPNLTEPTATNDLLDLFKELSITIPPNPTLPRLLDALAEIYIEPLCINPTFITEHPEALSPLSKSYTDLATGQRVASRIELFIQGREYVNAYEEENSPFEQRRKFEQQLEFHSEGEGAVDESYLEALEWGMPPTGGWGCGLDRLIMLFANKKRIADVLPFGTLRNVVGIAKNK